MIHRTLRRDFILVALGGMTIAAGCIPAAPVVVVSTVETATVMISPISTPSPTVSPTLAVWPTSTATPTPTKTLTPTHIPTLIPTLTLMPILTLAVTHTPTLTLALAYTPTPTFSLTPWPTPDGAAHERELRVPILMYHYISPLPPRADLIRSGLTVEPDVFRQQLRYLRDTGYESISCYELQYALAQGWPLPEKSIIFTFDDGYRDNYEHAFPLMKKLGYTGTIFLTTQYLDEGHPEYLTWGMVEEMAAAGWRIEPHTKTHAQLSDQPRNYIIYEVLGSMQTVQAHVGYQPRFFSYPSGQYDEKVIGILQEIGFWGAVTTKYGLDHSLSGQYTWGRIRVTGTDTLRDLAMYLDEPSTMRMLPLTEPPADEP